MSFYIANAPSADSTVEAIVETLKKDLSAGLEKYHANYATYYQTCKRPDSPAMRDPIPIVILVEGPRMVAFGKNKSESCITAEFYNCAVEVMRGAEALGGYISLPQQEAFDIEYWALEEAKLRRMPADKELAGRAEASQLIEGNGLDVRLNFDIWNP